MSEAPDYKKTVNLPSTGFPMKANLPQREPGILQRWAEGRIYEGLLEKNAGNPTFVLHDGPPYANNHIHQGHMLNKILKDFIVKARAMEGRRARFVPGWDCHGLPIELQVDKKLGKKKREMSKNEIRDACRAYAEEWIGIQREEFERLGIFGEWDAPYLTMRYDYEAATVRELARFAARGALYRGKKPVHWCIYDRTALAEAEVEYADHKSPSIYVAFDLVGELPQALQGEKVQVAIWTTTPWTLPANLAVAVHPDFAYLAYRLGDRVLIVAEDLLADVLQAVAPEELEGEGEDRRPKDAGKILARFEGGELEGLRYRHPFLDRESQVILGDHVTLEQGTGLVHTAPGHGQEDYQVGLQYGLEVLNPVDNGGFFTEEAGERLAGRRVFDANAEVIAILQESGHLLQHEEISHSYPHCWRCSNPVIFRATDQWFISMEKNDLRREALEEIDRVRWIPKWGRDRIHGMIENRPDWCISRQRAWGTPITVLYCEACDEPLVDAAVMERAATFFEKEGGNAWFARPASDFAGDAACGKCGGTSFRKEEDILDVWFDSGVSFSAVLEGREGLDVPADLYLEGSDQHRGWFHSSLLCSVGTRDKAPYEAVLTHGFVVDGQGRKISKRLGNYVDPNQLIGRYGAEIMRLWVASEDYRNDIRTSEALFRQLGEGYFKVRNTLRYLLSNLYDFEPARDAIPLEDLRGLDRWALNRLSTFTGRVRRAYDEYEFHLAWKAALDFCAGDMSAVYLDVRKDLLYCAITDSPARRACQTVMHRVATDLLRLLAPVLSFTAEEAWGHLPGEKTDSVFLAGLPEPGPIDQAVEDHYERLLEVRAAVTPLLEAARREKIIGKNLDARVVLGASGDLLAFLQKAIDDLPTELIVSQVHLVEGKAPEGQQAEGLPELTVAVEPAHGEKCVRCWTWTTERGPDPAHPELCSRCTEAVIAFLARG